MPVVDFGSIVLAKGVPQTLFEATALQLAGLFAGKVNLIPLADVADEIKISLQTKYTSGGAYVECESPLVNGKSSDRVYRLTPVEEGYGYRITIELVAASVSSAATLPYVIFRSAVE